MMYWPSAPMFQKFARNPSESPIAMRMRGAALTRICGRAYAAMFGSNSGDQKIVRMASNGFLPSTANMTAPAIIVAATAIRGVAAVQAAEASRRR